MFLQLAWVVWTPTLRGLVSPKSHSLWDDERCFALCNFQAQISRFKSRAINIVSSSLYMSQVIKLCVVEPSRGFGVSLDLRVLGNGDGGRSGSVAHLCVFVDSSKATHSGAFLALGMGQDALKYSQFLISELLFLQNTFVWGFFWWLFTSTRKTLLYFEAKWNSVIKYIWTQTPVSM